MKQILILFTLIFSTSCFPNGVWLPTGPLASNCAIFTMTGAQNGVVIIADYNSGLYKKNAGTNAWVSCGLNKKVRYLTTAPNGDIYAISGTGSYIVSSVTIIHRSTDNGTTWQDVFTKPWPYNNQVGGAMTFLPDNSILAAIPVQKGPTIGDIVWTLTCKSTDGGSNWFMTDSVQLGPPHGMIPVEEKVFMGTSEDGVYSAGFTGNHWWPIDTTAHFFGTRFTTDVVKSREGTIYAAINTQVKRSSDNGISFQTLNTPSPSANISAIYVVGDDELYIATGDKKVYMSNNSGNTWQAIINGLPSDALVNTLEVTEGKLYAGTYAYGVFYYQPDAVGIQNGNSEARDYKLNQNYPNPFNPSTKISFSIPKSSYVNLSVYDMNGRRTAILVSENKSSGNYDVNFDASNLAGGVYFYKLETENFSETRKMILVK